MDTASFTPPVTAPQIQCAPRIEPTVAQLVLLQHAFQDHHRIYIEREFQGYSGASIYLVTSDGRSPMIVKLAHPYYIRQEYAAYQQFVKDKLTLIVARIEEAPVLHVQSQLGLLRYTFIGVDPEKPASSLLDYYFQHGGNAAANMLKLIFYYGKRWWLYHQPQRIFPYETYNLLLPADIQLQVSTVPLPSGQVLRAQAIKPAMLRQLQPGQPVQLEGFQIIKVRPGVLTLSASALSSHQPAPHHLRLTGKLDKTYQPGEILTSCTATVETTQFIRLAAYAVQCLPELDPAQPDFHLEEHTYRNPLYYLAELLDTSYDTNFSIIHGDLNLQNIMVAASIEHPAQFAWLIDFAQTRHGPTLLDLQRLEAQIITKLLPANLTPTQLVTLLQVLHTKTPSAQAPFRTLKDSYTMLCGVRRLLPKYLIDSDKWEEYYRGLILVLLGALKFEELSDVARKRALLAAAILLDLLNKALLDPPPPWRKWWPRAATGLVLLGIMLLPLTLPNLPLDGMASVSTQTIPRDWTESQFGLHFVYVPAATFTMGSAKGTGGSDEYPQHTVTVGSFWMSKTEVTNEQYRYFVEATGYAQDEWWPTTAKTWRAEVERQQPAYWGDPRWNQADYPVVGVSWYEAVAYTHWLSHVLSQTVRLPTEAEWELAARGDDGRLYPWGNESPNKQYGNFEGNVGQTTRVGAYPQSASPYMLLDMAGNVWEWTSSQYIDYPYVATDGREDITVPAGRVVRGGAWKDRINSARTASRRRLAAGSWGTGLGIRLVMEGVPAPDPTAPAQPVTTMTPPNR